MDLIKNHSELVFALSLKDDYIAGVRSISRTEEDDNHEGMELEDEEQGEEQ